MTDFVIFFIVFIGVVLPWWIGVVQLIIWGGVWLG